MADQKIVGNLWVTGSYTIETQYVFCKECRVQFEPLITWQEFNSQKKKQAAARQVASLSPEKRAAHDARENLKKIKHKRSMAWQWYISILMLAPPLVFLIWIYFFENLFTVRQLGAIFMLVFFLPSLLVFRKNLKDLTFQEAEQLAILGKSKPN
jgi:hypothetical protein